MRQTVTSCHGALHHACACSISQRSEAALAGGDTGPDKSGLYTAPKHHAPCQRAAGCPRPSYRRPQGVMQDILKPIWCCLLLRRQWCCNDHTAAPRAPTPCQHISPGFDSSIPAPHGASPGMVLFLFGRQQPGKKPLAQRDGHDERLGGLAGAAAPTGHLECSRAGPPEGCDAVRFFGQPLSFHLGNPGFDAAATLYGMVSGQATQAAGTQAFAVALDSAQRRSVVKKAAPAARQCGFGTEATPSCW